MDVGTGCGCKEVYFILVIPTPLVSVLFYSSNYTDCLCGGHGIYNYIEPFNLTLHSIQCHIYTHWYTVKIIKCTVLDITSTHSRIRYYVYTIL